MAVKKRKKEKLKVNIYVLGIFLTFFALAAYFILSLQSKLAMSVIRTHTLDLGEVEKVINKDVVVVRKNFAIVSGREGLLTRFYQQGERIPKNSVICKIQDSDSQENEIAKLSRINLQIQNMKDNSEAYSPDIESKQIQGDIDYLYLDIQERIKNNDFKYVAKLKTELKASISKKKELDGAMGDVNVSLDELLNQKRQLEAKLASDQTYVKAPISGEVSYYTDGYEELFSVENFKKITVRDIKSATNRVKKREKKSVHKGDIIGYVVDNHQYYVATDIKKEDIEAIKRDVKLTFEIGDKSVNAYFYDFYKDSDGKFVGFFKIESDDIDFLRKRKENVDIVYDYAKGIVIPNEAIVDVSEGKGVFVVDDVGKAKFVKLENILISDEKNTVLQFSYDDLNDPSKVKLYDEVILSPKNIKDGQKVK